MDFYFHLYGNWILRIFVSRKSNTVCLLSWAMCFLYVILITLQSYAFPQPICNIVPNGYGSFFPFACAAAVSGFFFTFMMLSVRIFQASPGNERVPSLIALNVISVGLLSTLTFVAFNFNGVCIDAFGLVIIYPTIFLSVVVTCDWIHAELPLLRCFGASGLVIARQLSSWPSQWRRKRKWIEQTASLWSASSSAWCVAFCRLFRNRGGWHTSGSLYHQ